VLNSSQQLGGRYAWRAAMDGGGAASALAGCLIGPEVYRNRPAAKGKIDALTRGAQHRAADCRPTQNAPTIGATVKTGQRAVAESRHALRP